MLQRLQIGDEIVHLLRTEGVLEARHQAATVANPPFHVRVGDRLAIGESLEVVEAKQAGSDLFLRSIGVVADGASGLEEFASGLGIAGDLLPFARRQQQQ